MKVMLMTLPNEGQVLDWTTPTFYRGGGAVRYMPLGILSVANGISVNHQVKVLDASSRDLSILKTLIEIKTFKPDVLGISAVTRKAYAMAEILRWANVPLNVVGGPHVTHYAKETLALGAHAIFRYDGDYNFGAWLDGERRGGIFEDYIQDINLLPFPQYKLLNIYDYALPEEEASATLFKKPGMRFTMFSSKGCPFRCVFCDVQGKKFRWLSPSRIVDEMEHLLFFGATSIHILDDCFNIRRDIVLGICAEIQKRGLKFEWSARGRAELDNETAQALSEAGCRRLHVGIESLDDNALRWMNKKLDVDTIRQFCNLCGEHGIEVVAYFIMGTPVETAEYRKHLPEMIEKLGITYPYFNLLYPSPKTKYYESLLQNGTYKRDYWLDFAKNPTPDWQLPFPYHPEIFKIFEETINGYIKQFYHND